MTFSLYLKDRKWQPERVTETWVIMWRGAKAWALIIQVKEQCKIAPFVANIVPFHESKWLTGIWTATSLLQCKHIIHHFLDL